MRILLLPRASASRFPFSSTNTTVGSVERKEMVLSSPSYSEIRVITSSSVSPGIIVAVVGSTVRPASGFLAVASTTTMHSAS